MIYLSIGFAKWQLDFTPIPGGGLQSRSSCADLSMHCGKYLWKNPIQRCSRASRYSRFYISFLAENYLLPVALLSIREFFCFLTIFLLMPLSFKKQIGVASTYINITRCQSCLNHKDKADKLFKN